MHLPQDAPTTWTATSTAGLCSGCNLLSVAAVGTEFVVGSSQGIYRFTPGASTPWAAIPGGPTATIRSVTAFSPTDVYFMTTEATIYHYDGVNLANLAWPGPTLPATPLRDMVATGTGAARTVFGVAGGAVYRHTAGAWTDITPSEVLVPSFGVPPMPRFFAFAPDDVFLVGQTPSGTTILHWNGSVWSRVRSNAMLANAVWGPSSRYLAIVGDGAHLLDRTVAW